jgi:hypothetical protein
MATASIDLGDFTCSICRDIFQKPVNLSCSHAYCQSCLDGLKKSPSSSDEPSLENPSIPQTSSTRTLIYKPQLHENNQCFICAICRKESLGYFECRELEADLKTIEAPCPNCTKPLMLCDLRKHLETCTPAKKKINTEEIMKVFNPDFFKQLSQPQAQALEKAREGENRSTFPCPYCNQQNFTVENLCKHMEQNHLDEHPSRVCPICASMPWGDKDRVSTNVYQHILGRHRFDYSTYVNYEQDEEAMLAEAVERSMLYH